MGGRGGRREAERVDIEIAFVPCSPPSFRFPRPVSLTRPSRTSYMDNCHSHRCPRLSGMWSIIWTSWRKRERSVSVLASGRRCERCLHPEGSEQIQYGEMSTTSVRGGINNKRSERLNGTRRGTYVHLLVMLFMVSSTSPTFLSRFFVCPLSALSPGREGLPHGLTVTQVVQVVTGQARNKKEGKGERRRSKISPIITVPHCLFLLSFVLHRFPGMPCV